MGIEGEARHWRRLEGNPEIARLRREIERFVVPGAGRSELEQLLAIEPQRDDVGGLRYLVTSGIAVELVTGFERHHHDLDLVIFDPENEGRFWEIYGTDNVSPQWYWADMSFDPNFLDRTAREVPTRRDARRSPIAEVVHPAIIMVQKSSNAFGRPPRRKDGQDVVAIIRHWQEREQYTRKWNQIVRVSIDSLPDGQKRTTLTRLRRAIEASRN